MIEIEGMKKRLSREETRKRRDTKYAKEVLGKNYSDDYNYIFIPEEYVGIYKKSGYEEV